MTSYSSITNVKGIKLNFLKVLKVKSFFSPVVYAAERLLAGDVIHQDEAHGSPVVGGGDGAVPLLARCVLR